MLAGAGILGVLIAVAAVQYLFRDVDHFNLFHLGGHYHGADATLRQRIVPLKFLQPTGLVGMLFDPQAGLLPFFPFLAWGLWQIRKGGYLFVPVIVFFLVLGAYPGWTGGAGFSSRYLVPVLPALVIAVADAKPRSYFFGLALLYGAFWGALAGIGPAYVYERTPVQITAAILRRLSALAGI